MADHDLVLTPLRCPVCQRTSDESQFGITIPYKAAATGVVLGITADGQLAYNPIDRGDPNWFYRAKLHCQCGHVWITARDRSARGDW